jgi:superfamily II helicase
MKQCSKCLVEKPLNAFATNPACKDGYTGVCKSCKNARVRELREQQQSQSSIHELVANWPRVIT